MAVDHIRIDQLLRDSRAAHARALTARQVRSPEAQALLIEARDGRVQADALDPTHEAPAWAIEAQDQALPSHEAYLTFYRRKLAS
jgi:hypothetical protein